jgi:hypothetical protein
MNRLPNVQNRISQRFVRARVAGRQVRNILGFTLLMLMFVEVAVAGNLTGKVTSMSGVTAKPAPVGSVLVSVYQIETKRKTVTRTNNSGAYQFKNLAKGAYLIQVEKDGRQVYQGKVEVPDGDTTFDIKI